MCRDGTSRVGSPCRTCRGRRHGRRSCRDRRHRRRHPEGRCGSLVSPPLLLEPERELEGGAGHPINGRPALFTAPLPVRREQVAYGQRRGLSQRRSCTLLGVARSALGYRSRKAVKDAPVLAHMAALSAQYPRFGYRRIRIFLGREGHAMSCGRAYRLWRRARLQVPRRRPRKRIASGRPRPQAPTGANQVWSYDFVFDWCENGQQLKCLTVTDEWTKEGLAIEVDGRIRSGRVIEVLSRLISERGAPLYLRSDNGPEFVAHALLKWMADQKIDTAPIDPGKPGRMASARASTASSATSASAWNGSCRAPRPRS